MDRKATAVWKGGLKSGKGSLSTQSGALNSQAYTFSSRFEGAPQTNPEELVAAAHAGCFAMALSAKLEAAGFPVDAVEATSTVTLGKVGEGTGVTKVHLDVVADVPNLESGKFETFAEDAKSNCIISQLLNAPITMRASLRARV